MGACVSSDGKQGTAAGKNPPAASSKADPPAVVPTSAAALPSQNPVGAAGQKPAATPNSSAPLAEHLDALPPLFCERSLKDRSGKDSKYLVTAVSRSGALEVGCSANGGNDLYSAEITVQQLEHQLKQLNPPVTGATFAKAMKDAFTNGTVSLEVANVVVVKVPVGDAQVPVGQLRQARGADKALRNRLFSTPMFHYWATRKGAGKLPSSEVECVDMERKSTRLRVAGTEAARCRELRRRIERLQGGGASPGKEFDPSAAGPSTYVLHLEQSVTHVPALFQHNEAAMVMIRKQHASANEVEGGPPAAPTDAELKAIVSKANGTVHEGLVKTLDKLDDWAFDMFELAQMSENSALFHTTYALLHKHGLMGYFGLDHDTVVRFLSALEAGYHPNHYHNATHAADVLQCVHYILGPGGMIRELGLTPEEVLAALLASAMHDYDHPGLNNMYHIKTGAYLATLYNDRSVLENHHCASVFELLRHDRYNIFRHLTEDQRKTIRDTMLEMVLSTDMGLHNKIINQFKQRHKDLEGDGGEKKPREDIWRRLEDRRLVLSIVLKMADISNCARPLNLYKGWASRIADEFYLQGDLEREMGIALSPFMDRNKHDTDFPKGQTSFMRFIAIPLFEAGAEFLPKMEFAVPMMQSNQDYWNNSDKGGEV